MESDGAVAPAASERIGALRRSLPFGVVMATAGASTLAGRCQFQALVAPLLALAVLQALWVPLLGLWRHRAAWRETWRGWWTIGPADEHTGIHTVPLGVAVIAGGLAGWAQASGGAAGPLALAAACLVLAWLLTVICVVRFLWALMARGLVLYTVDGAWFLVPAALLGTAIATDATAGLMMGWGVAALAVLADAAALLGSLGYWAVAIIAYLRVRRFGLNGVSQAPWWIAMGCAGLAAAAFGRALAAPFVPLPLQSVVADVVVVTDIVAVLLGLPVLLGSVVFLLRRCRFHAHAVWTPTFSTAVFALGCFEAGDLLHSSAFRALGLGAGYATLAFWAVTTVWNARLIGGRSLPRVAAGDGPAYDRRAATHGEATAPVGRGHDEQRFDSEPDRNRET